KETGLRQITEDLRRYPITTETDIIMLDFVGNELWNYSLGETFVGGAPIVVNDLIFAVTNEENSRLLAVDLSGNLIEEIVIIPASYAHCSPVFTDGCLFIATSAGIVYAFDTEAAKSESALPPMEHGWYLPVGFITILLIGVGSLFYWKRNKNSR
ncbi:MAG TPA: PQQ-binding-like beta-propeller repeat protein, partial [Methanomassiliicoccaceae archaeon]|nr:PQQ-binding-like beta-propeller repeat protein [Methanomassiliicoccaceae archaeon]